MGVYGGPDIITEGLVLALDAGSKKSYPGSGTTWSSLVGSTNATLTNGPSFSNKSMVFDGVNDFSTYPTPHNDSLTTLTYELVFKGSRGEGYSYILHNNGTHTSTGNSWITFGWYADTDYVYGALSGRYSSMYDNTTIIDSNTYYHLTLTWDGSTQKFYINGDLKTSQALESNAYTLDSTTSIGGNKNGGYRMSNIDVAFLKIYNRALSSDEILQNYNAKKSRFI
jgi:hypothetical protein